MKYYITLLFWAFTASFLRGQDFQKLIEPDNTSPYSFSVLPLSDGNYAVTGNLYSQGNTPFGTLLSAEGEVLNSFRINTTSFIQNNTVADKEGYLYWNLPDMNNAKLAKTTTTGQIIWAKEVGGGTNSAALNNSVFSIFNENILYAYLGDSAKLLVLMTAPDGTAVWQREWVLPDNISANWSAFDTLDSDNGVILGNMNVPVVNNLGVEYGETYGFVTKISSNGNVLKTTHLKHIFTQDMAVLDNGNTMISGWIEMNQLDTMLDREKCLIMLDQDFNIIWAKKVVYPDRIIGENQLIETKEGVFWLTVHPGGCGYERMLSKIDVEGNILWTKSFDRFRYSYRPNVANMTHDFGMIDATEQVNQNKLILRRTDAEGNVAGCMPTLYLNPTLVDFEVEQSPYTWNTSSASILLSNSTLTASPLNWQSVDDCTNNPLDFDASFTLSSDTICANTAWNTMSAEPNSGGNSAWYWNNNLLAESNVEGELNNVILDTIGQVRITHVLSSANCADTVSRMLYISQVPDVYLGPDLSACDSVIIEASNPVSGSQLVWNTGSQLAKLVATSSGIYTINASIGNCFDTDSINVVIKQTPFVHLGPDTTLCNEYQLMPPQQHMANLTYEWQDQSTAPFLNATTTGWYVLRVSNQDCISTDSVFVTIEVCEPERTNVYIPNCFAPGSGDYKNERFAVFSSGVEIENLKIYDRWGALILQRNAAPFEWDGTFRGKMLQSGVFTASIRYRQLVDGKVVNVVQDVSLIR
jgi:gliding motility-associated-like protein